MFSWDNIIFYMRPYQNIDFFEPLIFFFPISFISFLLFLRSNTLNYSINRFSRSKDYCLFMLILKQDLNASFRFFFFFFDGNKEDDEAHKQN